MLERACKLKVSLISNNLLDELSSQQKCFKQLSENKLIEYNSEKEKIDITLQHLNEQVVKRTARSKDDCVVAEKDAQEYTKFVIDKAKDKFTKQLDEVTIGSDTEVYENIIKEMVADDYQKIQEVYIGSLDKIIGQNRDELTEILILICPIITVRLLFHYLFQKHKNN